MKDDKEWYLMTDKERKALWLAIWDGVKVLLTCMLIITLAVLCTGCKSVQYVPIEKVMHDTLIVKAVQKDSVMVHDSIYQERYVLGDTVFLYKYKEKVAWKDRVKLDSVYISKIDSIPVPYEVEKIVKVEKPFKWFHKIFLGIGFVAFTLALLYIGYIVARWKHFIK